MTNMANWNILILQLLLALTTLTKVTSVPWKECAEVVLQNGYHTLNCSGRELISTHLPHIKTEVEVLDFSNNRFLTIPNITESPECHPAETERHQKCHIVNSTNHCRVDISFSRNKISELGDYPFKNLMCLKRLDLSFNRITSSDITSSTFLKGVNHLQVLNLRGNPLGTLPQGLISDVFMKDLEHLDLSHCDLTDVNRDAVDDFSELISLDLSYNLLTTIHPQTFKGLYKLEMLDLRGNRLAYIPQLMFGDLGYLRSLWLSGNSISHIHENAFFRDSNLALLDLSHNDFKRIPYGAVDKLPRLENLDLSNNPIQTILPSKTNSSVQNLQLNNLRGLTNLRSGALSSFPNLITLSISNCGELSHIDPWFLGHRTSSLRHVTLVNNNLFTLHAAALPWQQLETLRLSNNPWFCDMNLAWIISANKIVDVDAVICDTPSKLRGHSLTSVAPGDLGRFYTTKFIMGIIAFCVTVPLTALCLIFIWKRKRFCACVTARVKGRYVSVYTRDMDAEDEQEQVAIELKVNVNRLNGVSNGKADDTRPFMTYVDKADDGDITEEEI